MKTLKTSPGQFFRGRAASFCRTAFSALLFSLWAGWLFPSSSAAAWEDTDQLIIKFRSESGKRASAPKAARLSALSALAGKNLTHKRLMSGNAHVLRLPSRSSIAEVQALASRLSADSDVEYAVPDRRFKPAAVTPDDLLYPSQWHYKAYTEEIGGANLPGAWDITTGAASVVVAVVDTGLLTHPDINLSRVVPGYDMVSDVFSANDGNGRDSDPADPGDWVEFGDCDDTVTEDSSWHGTHVAGTIGAATNNSIGVAGVNWVSKILPVRVLGKCGGSQSDILDGVRWAAGLYVPGVPTNANPAKIINMSLGGAGVCDSNWQSMVDEVVASGASIIVAAGNSTDYAEDYTPAACANVVTVAATNRAGGRASYTNFGSAVTIAAPGGEVSPTYSNGILSTLNTGTQGPGTNTYSYYDGTSMATPHVAGIASLLLSVRPGLTPAQVSSILTTTARAFPTATGFDCSTYLCGAGIVNAAAALQYDIYEPNNDSADAKIITTDVQQTHSIVPAGDIDWFKFTLTDISSVTIQTSGTAGDTEMWLYDAYSVQISSNDDAPGGGLWSRITAPNLPDGTYYVKVREYGNNGEIYPYYVNLTAESQPDPPASISGAALGASSITWTWSSVPGATQYKLYPSTGGAGIPTTNTFLTQSQLSTNTVYGARVSALNSGGESGQSTLAATYTLAAPPTGYSFVSAQNTSITVQWGANENPAGTQYRLDYWTKNGSTTSVLGTPTSATVSGLTVSTTYYLRVNARNGENILTASSNTLTAQTLPAPPGNFSGAAQGVSSITWTWNSVPGASQYKFHPSTGGAAITLANPALIQTGLSANTTYSARVSAVNSSGEGALAAATTVYTLAAVPASPALASVWVSSASATWASNQNPDGTFFTLELSLNDFSSVAASSRTAISTAAFSSLLPNTSYYFRVKAENGQGSPTGYTPAISTVTFAAVPSGFGLTQLSSTSLTAVWQRNSNPADTWFELSLSSTDFSTTISTPLPFSPASAVTEVNIESLAAETTYYARVRAVNRLGFVTAFSTASYFIAPSLVLAVDPALQVNLAFGNAALTIPPQAFSQAQTVTMQAPGSFPAPTSLAASLTAVNSGVEITTDKNLLPLKRLTLTLTYSQTQAAGLNETQFVIARYEPSRSVWIPYASTPDPAGNSVTASIDHLSLFQVMMAAPAGTLSGAVIKIFPNPVHTSQGQVMKFTGLPAGAAVKIYTFSGELVRGLTADASGITQWDGRNASGQPAASEVYLAFIKAGGDTKTLKVMVER
jgi:serine protease